MRVLVLLAIGFIAVSNSAEFPSIVKRELKASPIISKKTETIEGSGDGKSLSSHPDMEFHGSGYGSDDEDGDDIQGSGDKSDLYEGSGRLPDVTERPQVSTTSTTVASPPAVKSTTTTHAVLHPIEKLPDNDSEEEEEEVPGLNISEIKEEPTSTTSTTTTTTTTKRPTTTTVAAGDTATLYPFHSMLKPGIFAAVIGGTVVGLLTAVLLVMFIIHRMRKKDEGSYALDEPKPRPYAGYAYTKASTKEFYA